MNDIKVGSVDEIISIPGFSAKDKSPAQHQSEAWLRRFAESYGLSYSYVLGCLNNKHSSLAVVIDVPEDFCEHIDNTYLNVSR